MVEFIAEAVDVEIQVRSDGTVRPIGFSWGGRRYRIESWGRESVEERDGRSLHCYLVQTRGGDTWELGRDTETAQWLLMRHWAARHQAV
jgi:hypothetical protein